MKLKHSDIDYIGQILDDVLYALLDYADYHKLSKDIVDDFRYYLTEANNQNWDWWVINRIWSIARQI